MDEEDKREGMGRDGKRTNCSVMILYGKERWKEKG